MWETNPIQGYEQGDKVWILRDGMIETFYVRGSDHSETPTIELGPTNSEDWEGEDGEEHARESYDSTFVVTVEWEESDDGPEIRGRATERPIEWEDVPGETIEEYGDVRNEYVVGGVSTDPYHLLGPWVWYHTNENGMSVTEAHDTFLDHLNISGTDASELRDVSHQAVNENIRRGWGKVHDELEGEA